MVEGFRPGVMARLGLDAATVRAMKPALVYCSISGYGQEDPRADLPGHDVNYQAWAGALAPEGGTATMPRLPLADLAGGMSAAFGICAAVLGRQATGEGAYIDVSMTDVLATWTGRTRRARRQRRGRALLHSRSPATASSPPRTAGRSRSGSSASSTSGRDLCTELRLGTVAGLGFEERSARGSEMQRPRGGRHRRARPRTSSSPPSAAVSVPVAPVLDRRGMLESAPFPSLPDSPATGRGRRRRRRRSTSTAAKGSRRETP